MAIISNCTPSIIKNAALALKKGHLVAFPTETVYGLGADATNAEAVARIYHVKARPLDHPLIVHISTLKKLTNWSNNIPNYAFKLAEKYWPGPMTLVLPRSNLAKDYLTGAQENVAIRVPSNPISRSLLRDFENLGGEGVAAPSANRFGSVSPTSALDVYSELGNFLEDFDQIIDGGKCKIGIESTIIDCTGILPRILRPGQITFKMISNLLQLNLEEKTAQAVNIRVPGALKSHYSPKAQVLLSGIASKGDGFLAYSSTPTPDGAIRLGKPNNVIEYARILYSALRLADDLGLERVFVVPPAKNGIGLAIIDRLNRACYKNSRLL